MFCVPWVDLSLDLRLLAIPPDLRKRRSFADDRLGFKQRSQHPPANNRPPTSASPAYYRIWIPSYYLRNAHRKPSLMIWTRDDPSGVGGTLFKCETLRRWPDCFRKAGNVPGRLSSIVDAVLFYGRSYESHTASRKPKSVAD